MAGKRCDRRKLHFWYDFFFRSLYSAIGSPQSVYGPRDCCLASGFHQIEFGQRYHHRTTAGGGGYTQDGHWSPYGGGLGAPQIDGSGN